MNAIRRTLQSLADSLYSFRHAADLCALWSLAAFGVYILFSGIEDLLIDFVWIYSWLRGVVWNKPRVRRPSDEELASTPEKRIAVFVPLWHEHEVIGDMLAHNIASVRYSKYDFFVGAYPNDGPTLEAVRAAERRFRNVHLAVCPHDGPTSKPDCLNWIYQRMLLFEEANGIAFDVVITHDAEDLIHAEALHWANYFTGEYAFVQIPVLALPTPLRRFTHGLYCDEFAEFQTRDLPVRNLVGGFVPSAGVGTAYTREALDELAASSSNRIFEPLCLTEDYENGYRVHALGFRQLFVPVTRRGSFVVTREYFPQTIRAAIRQRTRWVTGIALQGWERHSWNGGLRQIYWLWRDRKGLLANPISLLTNVVCAYALAAGLWNRAEPPRYILRLMGVTLAMQAWRTAVRIGCSARIYGIGFGLLAPARAVLGNYINAAAAIRAMWRYSQARLRGEALVWIKTEHAYPTRAALVPERRPLGEILVGSAYLDQPDLDDALAMQPAGVRLGEYLVERGKLSEEDLYEALSLQQQLPLASIEPAGVSQQVARALPAQVAAQWKVLPFRVERGRLDVASPDVPREAMENAVRSYTTLEVRFHLITPMQYRELEQRLHSVRG